MLKKSQVIVMKDDEKAIKMLTCDFQEAADEQVPDTSSKGQVFEFLDYLK